MKCFLLLVCLFTRGWGMAQEVNPIVIGNSRFTFATPGLVRLEYALDEKSPDESTLIAFSRKIGYQDVEIVRKGESRYTISMPNMRLEYTDNRFPFGQINLPVYFEHEGKEKFWYMASEQSRNLRGALTPLDAVREPVERQGGLLCRGRMS